MDKLKAKLKGSTLAEAITSMTLVLLITGLSFTFFLQINTHGVKTRELQAFLSVQRILNEVDKNQSFQDEKWQENQLTISKKVTLLNQGYQSYLIQLEFHDENKRSVFSHKTIMYKQPGNTD